MEVHREAFRPARRVAHEEATLRQYKLSGANRWAPYGVDTDEQSSRPNSHRPKSASEEQQYLAMPEEAHYLWTHAQEHGRWGGYSHIGARLQNTARPRSVGPHERLVRSQRAARLRGEPIEAPPPPNPVHSLALEEFVQSGWDVKTTVRSDRPPMPVEEETPRTGRRSGRLTRSHARDATQQQQQWSARGQRAALAWPEESPGRRSTNVTRHPPPRAMTNTDIYTRALRPSRSTCTSTAASKPSTTIVTAPQAAYSA